MSGPRRIERRRLLGRAAGGAGVLLHKLSRTAWFIHVLDSAETANRHVQAAIMPRGTRAREYTEADLSPHFKSNGTHDPSDPDYQALASNDFADWRLELGGLVDRPLRLSLAELRALPSVTQITRHDCVEGWSCTARRAAPGTLCDILPLRYSWHGRGRSITKVSISWKRSICKQFWHTQ